MGWVVSTYGGLRWAPADRRWVIRLLRVFPLNSGPWSMTSCRVSKNTRYSEDLNNLLLTAPPKVPWWLGARVAMP